jgi:hypothetical protein
MFLCISVHQEYIMKVKLMCCGIEDYEKEVIIVFVNSTAYGS